MSSEVALEAQRKVFLRDVAFVLGTIPAKIALDTKAPAPCLPKKRGRDPGTSSGRGSSCSLSQLFTCPKP